MLFLNLADFGRSRLAGIRVECSVQPEIRSSPLGGMPIIIEAETLTL
jgi:hypothetical protein